MSKYAGKYNLITKTEQLLYDILIEVERLADAQQGVKAIEGIKIEPIKIEPKKQNKICKSCGQPHENNWDYGVCARRIKKEGAVK